VLEGTEAVQLKLQIEDLEADLASARKKLFGESTERRKKSSSEAAPEDIAADVPKKQTGHGRREQPKLEVVERVHITGEPGKCDVCGGMAAEWSGQFEESEEVDIIERRFVVTKHKRQKYRCNCGSCIQTAPGPTKLFEGARYSIGFARHVAMSKYADHLPLERQVKAMGRDGLIIDSQTLWDQIESLAWWLQPAHKALAEYVRSQPVIGADETHWRVMGEKAKKEGGAGKQWHVWALAAPAAVLYQIEDSRSADAAKKVLDGYEGTVICDGYAAYQSLQKRGAGFKLAHCWAHVRRKFVEIEEQYPKECREVLDWIGKLYQIERDARDGPPEERLEARRRDSREVLREIRDWVFRTGALPQSNLRRAIDYMGGVWDGLSAFLDDPEVELDNNRTERALRAVVVGRKNHYGSRSRRGTEVAALFYSLIESAKLAGVGPHTYLKLATDAALRGAKIPLPHEIGSAE
jgi:transposase